MKKILSIALALCMLLSLMPTAFAADAAEVGNAEELAAAAAAGGEVKLTADIILEESLTIKTDLSIDLNGFDISGSVDDAYGLIYIGTAGKLTIGGEGSVENDKSYAIGNYGALTVKGGSFKGAEDYAALYNFYYNENTYGKAYIKGGSFLSDIWNCGELEVSGGSLGYVDSTGKMSVSGGSVDHAFISEGDYSSAVNGKEIMTVSGGSVKVIDAAAQVGNNYYGSFDAAFAAAEGDAELKLLDDVVLGDTLTVSKTLSIDLNGKTVSGDTDSGYGLVYVGMKGDLTVRDSSEEGGGAITAVNSYAIGNYGKLTVSGGSFSGADAALYNFYYNGSTYGSAKVLDGEFEDEVWNCGELNVNGGEFALIDNSGKASVSGGTVYDIIARDGTDAPELENCGSFSVSGGVFGVNPGDYLVEGLAAVEFDDGMWYLAELYTVSFDWMYGDKHDSEAVVSGDTASEPEVPARAYHIFMGWYIDSDFSEEYDFASPVESDIELYARWIKVRLPEEPVEPEKPALPECDGGDGCASAVFGDVDTSLWYHQAVEYAVSEGLMKGVAEGEFDPEGGMTRAMMWTVLARRAGIDTEGGELWYSAAQQWAVENGISDGLNPTALVSRQELITMLWRSEGRPAVRGSLADFEDAADVAEWAVPAMRWAVGEGIIQGRSETLLDPAGSATRAELAQIFMNARA